MVHVLAEDLATTLVHLSLHHDHQADLLIHVLAEDSAPTLANLLAYLYADTLS